MKSINLGVVINGKAIFLTATGIKTGARGKVSDVATFLSGLDKGTARKVRIALRTAGYASLAATSRIAA